jgi:hypothetical protein
LYTPGEVSCRSLPHPWPDEWVRISGIGYWGKALLTRELVKTNLDLEGSISVSLIHGQIFFANERDLLIRCLGAEDVSKGHILEAFSLADIIVVGAKACQWEKWQFGNKNAHMLMPAGMPESGETCQPG